MVCRRAWTRPRDRATGRLIEPRIRPVSRAIRRLPSIVLSAAVSRKCGSTSSEFPFALRGKRQCSVEPIGAKRAVDRRLGFGKVRDLRSEPQPVEFGAGGGDLGAIDVAADPQMIERSREIEPGRDRPRQVGAERRAERLQPRQLDSQCRGQLVRSRIKPRVAGEADGCAGDGQPVEDQDIRIVAVDCAGDRRRPTNQCIGGRDPGPQFP